jgi:hypothetical protein
LEYPHSLYLQINKPTTKRHSTNQSKVKTINVKEKQKNYCGGKHNKYILNKHQFHFHAKVGGFIYISKFSRFVSYKDLNAKIIQTSKFMPCNALN